MARSITIIRKFKTMAKLIPCLTRLSAALGLSLSLLAGSASAQPSDIPRTAGSDKGYLG